jgi:poly(3-hydroxybutyrate) depolymerase
MRTRLPIFLILLLTLPAHAATNVFREGIAVEALSRAGRISFPIDEVERSIINGTWQRPKAGDVVLALDGGEKHWTNLVAGTNEWFEGRAMRGGYLYVPVIAEKAEVRLLEAVGHGSVYVNGEPRVGDVYQYGWSLLPVKLKAGTNDFLFQSARGRLRARLIDAPTTVFINNRDMTLPDLHSGDNETWGAAIVINPRESSTTAVLKFEGPDGAVLTPTPSIPGLSFRKVPFRIRIREPEGEKVTAKLSVSNVGRDGEDVQVSLRVRGPRQSFKETFFSEMDGSLQYFGVQPPSNPGEARALFLSLHGASVEAIGQADAYSPKTWGWLVAPTNRRPYGFDWEDWGRKDALEVLQHAKKEFGTAPDRTYLTGHSMGGHGTWQLGVTFPDQFASIGPSAGWVSFFSYGGKSRDTNVSTLQAILTSASASSDTLLLSTNLQHLGVYILHGDADDNVPVSEARAMRKQLEGFHRDWDYYEQPKAGHWWDASDEAGADCVDWRPMFDFFARHRIPRDSEIRKIKFTTMNPAVSSKSHWVTIWQQTRSLQPSTVDLEFDPGVGRLRGNSTNVELLLVEANRLGAPLKKLQLDGDTIELQPTNRIWLERSEHWKVSEEPYIEDKGPERSGPFKEAFGRQMIFVYGTHGTPQENEWAYAKARFDAESWWYRGNGAVDLVPDDRFDPNVDRDRSVILYGNAQTHRSWKGLVSDSPVQIQKGKAQIGDHVYPDISAGALFVRPRPGSMLALVGVVSGTDVKGMRSTNRLPYFAAGVGYPDFTLFDFTNGAKGNDAVIAAGYFGNDWQLAPAQMAEAAGQK